HYHAAADALAHANRAWLDRIITRRVPLKDWQQAYEKRDGDVKTVLLFEDGRLRTDRRLPFGSARGPRRLDRLALLAALRFGGVLRGAPRQARARPLAPRADRH